MNVVEQYQKLKNELEEFGKLHGGQALVDEKSEELLELNRLEERAYYIWKAKEQRGLKDEEIEYFLDRCTKPSLLPYFCTHYKRSHSLEDAMEWVFEMNPDTRKEI